MQSHGIQIKGQAGTELGQAQLKLRLDFTSIKICFIWLIYKRYKWLFRLDQVNLNQEQLPETRAFTNWKRRKLDTEWKTEKKQKKTFDL